MDPGHGGKDSGAVGQVGILEKDIVLEVAKELRWLLKARGFEVVMTRESDHFVTLGKRAHMANQEDADLFISLHANAAKNPDAHGVEVFYLSDEMDDYARAVAAAENAVLDLERELGKEYSLI